MKIRIFALAKELGLDSKDLIQSCNDAGLHVKSSPLASISPEERDMVLAFMKKGAASSVKAEEGPSKEVLAERAAKTREIRNLGARRPADGSYEDGAESPEVFAEPESPPVIESAPLVETLATPAPVVPRSPEAKPTRAAGESPAPVRNLRVGMSRTPKTSVASEVAEKSSEVAAPVRPSPSRLGPVPAIATRPSASRPKESGEVKAEAAPEPKIVAPPGVRTPSTPAKTGPTPEIRITPATAPASDPVAPPKPPQTPFGKKAFPPRPQQPARQPSESPVTAIAPVAEASPAPEVGDQAVDSLKGPQRPDAGNRGLAGIRDMRAQGTVRDRAATTRSEPDESQGPIRSSIRERDRDKKPRGPAPPTMALPNFKARTGAPTKSDGPVQKPDLKITAAQLKQNPLQRIMQQHKEEPRPSRKGGGTVAAALLAEDDGRAGRGKTGLNLIDAREARRKSRKTRTTKEEEEAFQIDRGQKRHKKAVVERKRNALVTLPITVRSLSEQLGRPAKDIIGVLMRAGKMAKINDSLDSDTALEIAVDLGIDCEIERPKTVADTLMEWRERPDDDFGVPLEPRAPIITILGHVDHGKTTLVDRIRSANVAAGEAGGITQHIAAYQVEHNGRKLTFVDTPGHAAFGEMRARGANVTDIVVLVVAANDGVMPQTVECISHTRAAEVPMVVAMNKIDLPSINQQKVLTDLSNHGVLPSEWGGDTEVVRVSGLTGEGVDDLLETLLLTADLHELRAPVDCPADGVCLEAFRDEGRGPVAWMVVRRGTLKVGDVLVCGSAYGRIRAMYNDRNQEVQVALPSTPVKVTGLATVPNSGEHFFVLDDIEKARDVAEQRSSQGRDEAIARRGVRKLEDFFTSHDNASRDLPLIIKADSPGSIEALRHEIGKLVHAEVKVKILHEGVGGVNESDVSLAASAGAIIIAFHVVADDRAMSLAEQGGVEIRRYNIIYNITEEIKLAMEGLLAPERVEVATGRAIVLRTFSISRLGTVAGCRVLNGTIERSNRIHVIRDQKVMHHYSIASLKREKDDVREVRDGLECGIRLDGFNDIKEGDILEGFKIEERKRQLEI